MPDGINRDKQTLSEVKNVDKQSFTKQLRDYADYSQKEGLKFNLYLRPDTKVSGPLQNAIDSGFMNRLDI